MTPTVVRLRFSCRIVAARRLTAGLLPLLLACGEPHPSGPPAPPIVTANPATPPPAVPKAAGPFIHLADAGGTVRSRLTEGNWPSWSPDGRRIAFERNGRILVIDIDGANEKELALGRWPAWSPDGTRIAFVADRAIRVVNADGSSVRRVLSPKPDIEGLAYDVDEIVWSPDGTLVAFRMWSFDWFSVIVVAAADGTGERNLTTAAESGDQDGPAWSPDGSRLVYWGTGIGLATIDRNGENNCPLDGTLHVGFNSRPAWTPDGQAITFTLFDGPILIMPLNGGPARVLIQDAREGAWSADGRSIAFVRN